MAKEFVFMRHKNRVVRRIVEDVKPSLDAIFHDAAAKDFKKVEVLSKGRKYFFDRIPETRQFREVVGELKASGWQDEVVVRYGLEKPADKLKRYRKPKRGPGTGF